MFTARKATFSHITQLALLLVAVILLLINIYGLFQPLRKDGLGSEKKELIRFQHDTSLPYQDSLARFSMLSSLAGKAYIEQMTFAVSQAITHIEWFKVDAREYHQLVPIWENYILYFTGLFSGLEFYERYHFIDYHKSVERGIGICGDASMIYSQLLDEHGIDNQIVTFPGHVVVEVTLDNQKYIADPDFGVFINTGANTLKENKTEVINSYLLKGYTPTDAYTLIKAYSGNYQIFEDTYHFLTKRYWFEYGSYILKWVLPLLMLGLSAVLYKLKRPGINL